MCFCMTVSVNTDYFPKQVNWRVFIVDTDCVLCEVRSNVSYVLFIVFVNVSLRKDFQLLFCHVFSVTASIILVVMVVMVLCLNVCDNIGFIYDRCYLYRHHHHHHHCSHLCDRQM